MLLPAALARIVLINQGDKWSTLMKTRTSGIPFGQIVSMAAAITLLLGMAAGLHAVAGDEAQVTPPQEAMTKAAEGTQATTLSADDKGFIETALKGGLAEVQEVQLAQKKAANPELRSAAAQLEKEHQALNSELSRIGSRHGVALPKEPGEDRKALYDQLQKLSGNQFDEEFLKAGAAAHQKTIALFERTQAQTANAEIKKLAGDTLPTLKKHRSMLHGLQEPGKAPASDSHRANSGR